MREPLIYLFDDFKLYIGDITEKNKTLCPPVDTLVVSLDQHDFLFREGGDWFAGKAVLLEAGKKIDQEVSGQFALFYIEPGSHFSDALKRQLSHTQEGFFHNYEALLALQSLLKKLATFRPQAERARAMLFQHMLWVNQSRYLESEMDERVRKILDHLSIHPEADDSIEQLANMVFLSQSRLAHLFRTEVGVSLRQYRRWVKLRYALTLMSRANPVKRALANAGFHGSKDFSNTLSKNLGVSPSTLYGKARYCERIYA